MGKAISHHNNTIFKYRRLGYSPCHVLVNYSLTMVFLSSLAGGCLSSPDVSKIIRKAQTSEDPPRIVSAQGLLSREQSNDILYQLRQTVPPTNILSGYLDVMDSLTQNPITAGNKVKLLADDPMVYDTMFQTIESAKVNINVETFFIDDDRFGNRLAELLIQKQTQGVQVNFIYDSIGSEAAPDSFFKRLQDAGIQVIEFSPVKPPWHSGRGLRLRLDHRKIIIVDGTVAITGGTNISEGFFIDVDDPKKGTIAKLPWRDTDVLIEGPAVAQLQRLFLDNWKKQNGPEIKETNYFPELKNKGDALVRIISSSPGKNKRLTFVMYITAITFARHSIHITAGYFVPDKQLIKALTAAAERGVDVKIVLPLASDYISTVIAGQFSYSKLLKAGVKLYVVQNEVLHAKTAVIDGIWSTIGSTNMDNWSFLSNDEVNTVILDRHFAAEMEALFEKDMENSVRIKLEQWQKRPLLTRFNEWFTHLFIYWL